MFSAHLLHCAGWNVRSFASEALVCVWRSGNEGEEVERVFSIPFVFSVLSPFSLLFLLGPSPLKWSLSLYLSLSQFPSFSPPSSLSAVTYNLFFQLTLAFFLSNIRVLKFNPLPNMFFPWVYTLINVSLSIRASIYKHGKE